MKMSLFSFSAKRILALFLTASALFVAGCGSVSNIKTTEGSKSDALSSYKSIVVLDFSNKTMAKGKDSAKQEEQRLRAEMAGKNFADRIASELASLGIFDVVSRNPIEGDCLVVTGDVLRFQEGNAAARLWVGMGAGSAYFDANVRFVDGASQETVGHLVVDKNSWVLGGGLAAGQTVEHFMDRGAKMIAKELSENRKGSTVTASVGSR